LFGPLPPALVVAAVVVVAVAPLAQVSRALHLPVVRREQNSLIAIAVATIMNDTTVSR